MAHDGSLETHLVSDEVQDIRGTTVRESDGNQLGTVDDVIFDHDSMGIGYLVVDSGVWLAVGTFLLPAGEVFADQNHDDGLATGISRQQIEDAPQYDK
jgi:sporulation protein YlmC with PRC-barrel domain